MSSLRYLTIVAGEARDEIANLERDLRFVKGTLEKAYVRKALTEARNRLAGYETAILAHEAEMDEQRAYYASQPSHHFGIATND